MKSQVRTLLPESFNNNFPKARKYINKLNFKTLFLNSFKSGDN